VAVAAAELDRQGVGVNHPGRAEAMRVAGEMVGRAIIAAIEERNATRH